MKIEKPAQAAKDPLNRQRRLDQQTRRKGKPGILRLIVLP
jgi:hypothetical protein